MKKITMSLLWMFLSLNILSAQSAGNGEMYNMPSSDGHIDKQVTEPLTFYDQGGESGKPGSYIDGITVCFIPKNGEKIEITFEEVDLSNGILKVYNGLAKVIEEEDPWGWDTTYELPSGSISELTGQLSGATFTSTAEDGKLTIGYNSKYVSGKGWKATVKSVIPKTMDITGCYNSYNGSLVTHTGKLNQPILAVNIQAEGTLTPKQAENFIFNLTGITQLNDISNLKIFYTGSKNTFDDEILFGNTSSISENIKITGTQTLISGDNYFWLAGDVDPDAKTGNILTSVCSDITISGNSIKCTPAETPAKISIEPLILLQNKTLEYTINGNVPFYDDGGKEENISSGFEGTVILRPSDKNKRIQIDFATVDFLLGTGSLGRDVILKVYNGSTIDEKNLNIHITEKKTLTVKSAAADGSLTVYLKSVKDYVAGKGFEATISQFTPQAMTVDTIALEQITDKTIAAGDTDCPVLSLNIVTSHTEPSLITQNFNFTTGSTTNIGDITKATLYYTGRESQFNPGTAVKFGELNLSNNTAFQINGSQILREGNNYFWLTYDAAINAMSGNKLDAGCTSVILSGNETKPKSDNPEGTVIIKNEYISTIGTFKKTIYGNWTFTHTPNPYGSGYKAEIGDQTTTFIPGNSDHIIQLDFSSFDVYYSSSSYGTKAKFEIYSGKDINPDNLLWKLAKEEDKGTGPGKILRSTSPDGAITIVFNANTTSSYSNGKGWMSSVKEYKSKPMAIKSVTAFQASTEIVKPAQTDQEILGIEIITEGDLNPLDFNNLSINLKESRKNISNVSIYYTGNKKEFNTSGLLCSTADIPSDILEFKNLIPAGTKMEEGAAYYWIAYDINPAILSDEKIDAALSGIEIGGQNIIPVVNDPEGERITKNIYELKTGDNGNIIVNGTLLFYDDGGADGKYSQGFDGYVTFSPKTGNEVIKLSFKQFSLFSNASVKMNIYAGSTILEKNLIFSGNGTDLPADILSPSEDGKITIHFTSNSYSYANDGWEIEVTSEIPKNLTVTSVTSSGVNESNLFKGTEDAKMLKIAIKVEGDRGIITTNKIKFDAGGSTASNDISEAHVYYTGTSETFFNGTAYADSQKTSPFIFEGNISLTKPGTYYFWLAYNINTGAKTGNTISAKLSEIYLNNEKTTFTGNETSSTIQKGFSGNYVIGTSDKARYKTIQTAIKAMENGIDGPVVFELEPGEYNEIVLIPDINGTSSRNTITIKSQSGDYKDVKIWDNAHIEPDYGEEKNGMFTIYGTDFVTVEGVTFTTTDIGYPSVFNIKHAARNTTLKNCRFFAGMSTDIQRSIKFILMEGENEANRNNDNTIIENNIFDGGYMAIDGGGALNVNIPRGKGGKIINNRFYNQGTKSIYFHNEDNATIAGNTIYNDKTDKAGFIAIDLVRCNAGLQVYNNTITLNTKGYSYGMEFRPVQGETGNHARIYNNIINFSQTTGQSYGLYIAADCSSLELAYNTVLMNGISEKSACVYHNCGSATKPKNITFINNLFQNKANGYVYWMNNALGLPEMKFITNGLYTSSQEKFAYTGNEYIDFNAWNSIAKEEGSVNAQALFLTNDILDLKSNESMNIGTSLNYAASDIAGTTRSMSAPTIGAYEYTAPLPDAPQWIPGYPVILDVTDNQAIFKTKTDQHSRIFYLIKENGKPVPSADEVCIGDTIEIPGNQDTELTFTGLSTQTSYIPYFVLYGLRNDKKTEVLSGIPFETTYEPTQVSTFEYIKDAGTNPDPFINGTASFAGFLRELNVNEELDSRFAARIKKDTKGIITLTNTQKGLEVNGFHLQSKAPLIIESFKGDEKTGRKTITSTNKEWIFCNLRDMGEITRIELSSTDTVYIDNFSGEPLNLNVNLNDTTITAGSEYSVYPQIKGGVQPYTYAWQNSRHETLSTDAVLTTTAVVSEEFSLIVTDAWNISRIGNIVVKVTGNSYVATFEELHLEPESHWNGDTNRPGEEISFYSGSYGFNNLYDKYYWSHFGYSNETSTDWTGNMNEQFRAATGSGINGSANYAVAYVSGMGDTKITITNKEKGDSVQGCYISNTAWAKYAVINGDGMSTVPGGFKQGDWFILTATGKTPDGISASSDFYLADYRSENPEDHYCLDTWEWFDLRALGKIMEVSFTMNSSKKNYMGFTTPAYFCIDDFNGSRNIKQAEEITVHKNKDENFSLSSYFNDFSETATINYSIEDTFNMELLNAHIENGTLKTKGLNYGHTNLIIGATQKGHKEFINIPVKVDQTDGLEINAHSYLTLYPVPAKDWLHINTDLKKYHVKILNTNGTTVWEKKNMTDNETIDVSNFINGVYIVQIYNSDIKFVKRFTKQ